MKIWSLDVRPTVARSFDLGRNTFTVRLYTETRLFDRAAGVRETIECIMSCRRRDGCAIIVLHVSRQ